MTTHALPWIVRPEAVCPTIVCAHCRRVCLGEDLWLKKSLPRHAEVTQVVCPSCFAAFARQYAAGPTPGDQLFD
jgi:hypothetical protein